MDKNIVHFRSPVSIETQLSDVSDLQLEDELRQRKAFRQSMNLGGETGVSRKDTTQIILDDLGLSADNYKLIAAEDKLQIEKRGHQGHLIWEWLGFITGEVGELAAAISEKQFREGSLEDIANEAIQVSTLALKMAIMAKKWQETNLDHLT